jgi:hypothetical protein
MRKPLTYDMAAAMREGWLLAEDDVRGLEIQKYDEDCKNHFDCDADALAFVQDRAKAGSFHHRHVLAFIDKLQVRRHREAHP